MDADLVWEHIDGERAWLADLLDSLPDSAWRRPSRCAGWTVRDVAAHLTFAHARVRDLLVPAVRAGFRYDVIVHDTAVRSPLTHREIVATLRAFVGSRRRVAFITDLEPLIDILVHNQDICRPLGIEHPMPAAAAVAAADRVLSTPRPIRRWAPPRGVRLVATDIEWTYDPVTRAGRAAGDTVVERRGPMGSHLLTLTGRPHTAHTPQDVHVATPSPMPPTSPEEP